MVTIVEGDAHQTVSRLKEPIDVVFIDADKEGYVDYLNKLAPLVKPGGLILAHNAEMVPDYLRAVTARDDLETVLYGSSLAVTLKKR
jgi:caffeoyl-CoA O-methyltransferase